MRISVMNWCYINDAVMQFMNRTKLPLSLIGCINVLKTNLSTFCNSSNNSTFPTILCFMHVGVPADILLLVKVVDLISQITGKKMPLNPKLFTQMM